MPYDVHDGSGSGSSGLRYSEGQESEEPTDVFVPHIEPEDEEALLFRSTASREAGPSARHEEPPRPERLNQVALAGLINLQARDKGVDSLLQVRDKPERLPLTLEDVSSLVAAEPGAADLERVLSLKDRLTRAGAFQRYLPLQSSANVYTVLRSRFHGGIKPTVDLATTYRWPVVASEEHEVGTTADDLARYYRLRRKPDENRRYPSETHGSHPESALPPHHLSELREALDDLRSDTGAKVVNLFNDWRMWLTWLDAGNPIICLGALSKSLLEGKPGHTRPDREKPFFKHAFIIAGYEVKEGMDIFRVAADIGSGKRRTIDVPTAFIVRASGNPEWGENGHLRIPYADFQNQFRDAYGLLFNDNIEPPSGG